MSDAAIASEAELVLAATPQLLRDGDTLILTFPDRLSAESVDNLRRGLRTGIPETVRIVFVDGCSGAAIYRSGEPETD